MMKQVSPFAALTGAEKQIRWLEYQSIRLPYVEAPLDVPFEQKTTEKEIVPQTESKQTHMPERPQPPPEVPRVIAHDYNRTKHSQYDAVIARLKQAELQARVNASQFSKQG